MINYKKRFAIIETHRKTFLGHIKFEYKLWCRLARFRHTTHPLYKDFLQWAVNDPSYSNLYNAWEQENFSIDAAPTVDHLQRDRGFGINNLIWCRTDVANGIYMEEVNKIPNNSKWDKLKTEDPKAHSYYLWNGQLKKYGLDRKQWDELLIKSNGRCMLMGEQFKSPRDCHIDHDHKTGKVRGLLCARCNHLLAGFDDLKFRKFALRYLKMIFIQD
jgi:hypothetical protein